MINLGAGYSDFALERHAAERVAQHLRRGAQRVRGSAFAERILPYAIDLHRRYGSELMLLSVPEIPEAESYGILAELVAELRQQAEARAEGYLRGVLAALAEEGVTARGFVGGMGAARTISEQVDALECGMIMLATHGRSGLDGLLIGSVASRVVRHAEGAIFMLPIHERWAAAESRVRG